MRSAARLRKLAAELPGTRSAVFESLGGEPWPRFEPDAAACAAHRVQPGLVQMTADLLLTGGQLGELDYDGKHYRVRISPESADMGGTVGRRSAARGDGALVGPATSQPVALGLAGPLDVRHHARDDPERARRARRLRPRRPERGHGRRHLRPAGAARARPSASNGRAPL